MPLRRTLSASDEYREKKMKMSPDAPILASSLQESQDEVQSPKAEFDSRITMEKLMSIADVFDLRGEIVAVFKNTSSQDMKTLFVFGITAIKAVMEKKKLLEEMELKLKTAIAEETKRMQDTIERKSRIESIAAQAMKKLRTLVPSVQEINPHGAKIESEMQALKAQYAAEAEKVVHLNAQLALLEQQKAALKKLAEEVHEVALKQHKDELAQQQRLVQAERTKVQALQASLDSVNARFEQTQKQLQSLEKRTTYSQESVPNFL